MTPLVGVLIAFVCGMLVGAAAIVLYTGGPEDHQ